MLFRSDAVYRAAVHNCRCTADAEDVVQDVFEKLLHLSLIHISGTGATISFEEDPAKAAKGADVLYTDCLLYTSRCV